MRYLIVSLVVVLSFSIAKGQSFPSSQPSNPPNNSQLSGKSGQNKTNDTHLLREGFNYDLTYAYLRCRVNSMPLEIRNVPVHPDDSWASGNQGPIDQLKYNCDHSLALSLMYAWESGKGERQPGRVNFGIGLDWMLIPQVGAGASEAERNYTDAVGTSDRGYGAALTYLGLRQGGVIPPLGSPYSDFFLNWTPRIKLEVAPFDDPFDKLWFGTSVSYFTIDAQNGWDRYDSDQPHKDYILLHAFPIRAYATLFLDDKESSGITAGAQFQPGSKTAMGKEADVSITPLTFFAGLSWRW